MDVQMPSTSTQNRFCDAYKSTFLKQVYNRELKRFDPAKLPLHSHKMQRRLRRVRVMPNGDIVGRPRTAVVFSPVKKYPSTSDLCRPVGIDGYRRTLALPPSPERPAKLGGTLARPPQFDAESTLNMLERRSMLARELTQVSAQLEEEETHVQPQLERMVRAATKRPGRGGNASPGSLASVRSSARRFSARGSGAGAGAGAGSQRGTGRRRPGTAMSFSSVAPNFTWEDSFNTTYKSTFRRANDATLKRNYLNMKRRKAADAAKLDVVRLVPQSPETSHLAEPALKELASTYGRRG